ncbi:MAG: hypothetical protein U0Q16_36085 [Bryobacteraceae bacterium]
MKTRPVASAVTTFDGARRVAATSWTAELIFDATSWNKLGGGGTPGVAR